MAQNMTLTTIQNSAKIGLAVSIEASSDELMEQQDKISPASPPF
jgi:mitochondrial import receptor subunit TOM40